jgi:hypothetical protein
VTKKKKVSAKIFTSTCTDAVVGAVVAVQHFGVRAVLLRVVVRNFRLVSLKFLPLQKKFPETDFLLESTYSTFCFFVTDVLGPSKSPQLSLMFGCKIEHLARLVSLDSDKPWLIRPF